MLKNIFVLIGVCYQIVVCRAGVPTSGDWRPVVLMHGMNGHASNLEHLRKTIESRYPGIYVHNLNISNGMKSVSSSFYSVTCLVQI